VKGGDLLIHGLLRTFKTKSFHDKISGVFEGYEIDWTSVQPSSGGILPLLAEADGTSVAEAWSWLKYDAVEVEQDNMVTCLPTLLYSDMIDEPYGLLALFGIILRLTAGDSGAYKRIGVFEIRVEPSARPKWDMDSKWDFMTSAVLGQRGSWLNSGLPGKRSIVLEGSSEIRII
jgi:hypothetical protein